jgi:hypothetical protein
MSTSRRVYAASERVSSQSLGESNKIFSDRLATNFEFDSPTIAAFEIGCEIAVADFRDAKTLKAALAGADGALVICPMIPKAADTQTAPDMVIEAIGEAIVSRKSL